MIEGLSTEQIEGMFDAMPFQLLFIDENDRVRYWNDSTICGQTPDWFTQAFFFQSRASWVRRRTPTPVAPLGRYGFALSP